MCRLQTGSRFDLLLTNSYSFVPLVTMFAKPFTVKPYTTVKSSEQRSLFQKIQEQCGGLDAEVRSAVVPKQIQTAKLMTAANDKLQVLSVNQVPFYVVIDGAYVPTTALMETLDLDLQLKLCPTVYTVPNTIQFLKSGADFMLPGAVPPLPDLTTPPGTPIQIREMETNRLMATGLALVDLSKVTIGEKGRGIKNVNTVGDRLTPETTLGKAHSAAPPAQALGQVHISEASNQDPNAAAPPSAQIEKPVNSPSEADGGDDVALTQEEADEAFVYAVMKTTREPHEYPMSMAGFATLLQGNMPYEHPDLNIKATSFKKMNKLLKYFEKRGRLATKERGGELLIVSVKVPDSEKLPDIAKPKPAAKQKDAKISVIAYYKPPPALRRLFAPKYHDTKDAYEARVIQHEITEYVKSVGLSGGKEITLSEQLRSGLGQRQTVTTIESGKLVELALKQCSQYFKLVPPGVDPESLPLETGNVPKIEISTDKRLYGKMMTLVPTVGVLKFHINAQQLCEELRHVCAGSASVLQVRGVECIAVQGSHVDKVRRVLENRGIKSNFIVNK